ncbi:hypothetical protein TTHERM_000571779 (macronuclear) [Tetrahymena thermophila SB210]|uniref:Uncharacterized protein n=1 Tax=Tetrahymena thermophila (strain SB210) TaxID=312017 RepID=W7XGZ1_TETTS|nr:hypothetical protein TTHERM_000571779 [Tetrahymena thermophila SB210]EWS72279.1 hypothetical protein TTHERM_000571779 [Tetrahymena thermophila SB210]|eukprot:XP_012655219.1 hypothetical protein TTHERM_000571779 [Tetrahymena thermophila SB210]
MKDSSGDVVPLLRTQITNEIPIITIIAIVPLPKEAEELEPIFIILYCGIQFQSVYVRALIAKIYFKFYLMYQCLKQTQSSFIVCLYLLFNLRKSYKKFKFQSIFIQYKTNIQNNKDFWLFQCIYAIVFKFKNRQLFFIINTKIQILQFYNRNYLLFTQIHSKYILQKLHQVQVHECKEAAEEYINKFRYLQDEKHQLIIIQNDLFNINDK